MTLRALRRGNPSATRFAVRASRLVIAVFVIMLAAAGCSRQPAAPRSSVQACVKFGVNAIQHHVTVTSLPPQCQGLTQAQVNFAVGSALHSAAIGARGKAAQRKRIAAVSHYLEGMVTAVPEQHVSPQLSSPAGQQSSGFLFGLLTLGSLLISVGFGLWLMAQWFVRRGKRRTSASRFRRPPALNFAHLMLAIVALILWIAYLATGEIGLARAGFALLALATGLGMALAFLMMPGGAFRRRRSLALGVVGHIAFAVATLVLALVTAVG